MSVILENVSVAGWTLDKGPKVSVGFNSHKMFADYTLFITPFISWGEIKPVGVNHSSAVTTRE